MGQVRDFRRTSPVVRPGQAIHIYSGMRPPSGGVVSGVGFLRVPFRSDVQAAWVTARSVRHVAAGGTISGMLSNVTRGTNLLSANVDLSGVSPGALTALTVDQNRTGIARNDVLRFTIEVRGSGVAGEEVIDPVLFLDISPEAEGGGDALVQESVHDLP